MDVILSKNVKLDVALINSLDKVYKFALIRFERSNTKIIRFQDGKAGYVGFNINFAKNSSSLNYHHSTKEYHATSPELTCGIYDIRRATSMKPRLLIINETEFPTTSCTEYFRYNGQNFSDLLNFLHRGTQIYKPIYSKKTICVFDLDRVIINDNCKLIPGALEMLIETRKYYDLLVLWSHGSNEHVLQALSEELNNKIHFDCILSRTDNNNNDDDDDDDDDKDEDDLFYTKNLLYLYQKFPHTEFVFSVLVDDTRYNVTAEYSYLCWIGEKTCYKQVTQVLIDLLTIYKFNK